MQTQKQYTQYEPDATRSTAMVTPLQVPAVAWAIAALAMFALYLMLQENGAVVGQSWHALHEFFHDGRHIFGVPCH